MCGIAGAWEPRRGRPAGELTAIVRDMAAALTHRGPDDEGAWADAAAGLGFGHRRLAVVDLSPAGHQPMASADGRLHLVFNGEIYDHRPLRARLERDGTGFRGTSDTEVLLEAIAAWGLAHALDRVAGMFAFALWDSGERSLHLVRDRLGEKPLYYGLQGGALLFGSELKALRRHPAWEGTLDRAVLGRYLRLARVPAPDCMISGLRQLPPGHRLSLRAEHVEAGVLPEPTAYWSAAEAARRGALSPWGGTAREAEEELERRLVAAVRDQLVADVPVGAFLSGGIDSSTVVALAQEISTRPVRTFSIGFAERDHDESGHARRVAAHLGTDHEELEVTPAHALAVVPKLPHVSDEPFADPSQLPTFLVAQLARGGVTVALSGDGGDELFSGYNRHAWAGRVDRLARACPSSLRTAVARAVERVPARAWSAALRALGPLAPAVARGAGAGDKVHALAALLRCDRAAEAWPAVVSHWARPEELVRGIDPGGAELVLPDLAGARLDRSGELALIDLLTYLPDDVLTKVDRAAMACSLETRLPLLDHRVVELALRLPARLKVRHGQGKWILRRLLARRVPPELTDRPKAGFGVPIAAWLRGPLRTWAEDLLSAERLERGGYLRPGPVRRAWAEHVSGRRAHHDRLWAVLVFEAWREAWHA